MTESIFKKVLWLNISVIALTLFKLLAFPYAFASKELSDLFVNYEEKYFAVVNNYFYQGYTGALIIILILAYFLLFKFKNYGRKLFVIAVVGGILHSFTDLGFPFFYDALDYALLLINVMLDGFIICSIYYSKISKNFK